MEVGVEIQEHSTVRLEGVPHRFNFNELSEATEGFSEESVLGRGGFGVVYRGKLKRGLLVAIKRMNPEATRRQGKSEFKSEVEIISQVSHRNLIKLRGYCDDSKEYMLVYDLMPSGNLDDALFNGTIFLSWPQKFRILTGAADGLSYLHQGLDWQVIHRDIKCSNVLLDREWNAKLGDFGIARLVAHQRSAATTDMAGTLGYIAPEVFFENQFTDKADVYAFGVVVLEVACGRRVFSTSSNQMRLVEWVRFAHSKGKLNRAVDKRHSNDDTEQIRRVLQVGLLCTQPKPRDRPPMRRVVQMLAGDVGIPSVPTSKATSLLSGLKTFLKMFSSGSASSRPTIMERDESLRAIEDSHTLPDASRGVIINESPSRSTSKSVSPGIVSRGRQILNVDSSPSTSSASGSHGAIISESSFSNSSKFVSPDLCGPPRPVFQSASSYYPLFGMKDDFQSKKFVSPSSVSRNLQIWNVDSSPSTSSASGSSSALVFAGFSSVSHQIVNLESPSTSSASGRINESPSASTSKGVSPGLVSVSRQIGSIEPRSTPFPSGLRIRDVVNVGSGEMGSTKLLVQSDHIKVPKAILSYDLDQMVEQEWDLPFALQ